MNLQPFTIEAYERGEEVVYRNGEKPDEVLHFKTITEKNVRSVWQGTVISHHPNGVAVYMDSQSDLMIKPKTVEKFCNLYKDGSFGGWHTTLEALNNLSNKNYAFQMKGVFINGEIANIEPIQP